MEAFLAAARVVHFAATISLAGVFAFECLVADPAALPERVDRRLVWLAWASLALALVSAAAWLVAVTSSMSGRPLAAVLSQGLWQLVLTRTRFGEAWLVRLGLAGVVAVCLALQRRVPTVRWAALVFASPLLAGIAWSGHGAATPDAPGELHLAADILHLLGAGGWLGTLVPFALLLIELRRAGAADWAARAGSAARRFSMLACVSVAMLLAGGLVNTWFLAGTVPALIGTGYGRLLLAKIALFLATLTIAAVNLLRLTPRLADAGSRVGRAVLWLQRNALAEAALGVAVLAIVGILGILPPGLHSEPGWPLPFRIEVAALSPAAKVILLLLLAAFCAGGVALVASAAAAHYRRSAMLAGGLILCIGAGWLPLRAAIEPAYPTSFYAPAEPYDAGSLARGAVLYADNCALCHGTSGRGDGPAAAGLPVHPANLTEAHLFAHRPGDLFWWVGNGRGNGAMPGFAAVLRPDQRWDVINFIRARAAGILARRIGPQIAVAVATTVPDFAFETTGAQETLNGMLMRGPALLVLFAPPAPTARLAMLASARLRLGGAGLRVIAVETGSVEDEGGTQAKVPAPLVADVAPAVKSALALFRAPADGSETELLLDRGGDVRARWTAADGAGLPDVATLVADAALVAQTAAIAPSHVH
jgi:putative copper export protein/mono/diheme cytochrome c family protein